MSGQISSQTMVNNYLLFAHHLHARPFYLTQYVCHMSLLLYLSFLMALWGGASKFENFQIKGIKM